MSNFLPNRYAQAAMAFVLFVLLLSTPVAFAGTPTPSPEFVNTVGNLTSQHSNNDYGQKIINWIAFGKPDNVKFGDVSLLSTVSFTLNAIALVMMAYLSLLGGLTYVIQTANKGSPGGQVISSFWMPIRIATATILLVPLASGYSTIQYGVITVAEKGNAHGSYLMDQGIDYIAKNGVYRPPMMESSKDVVIGLIWSELCQLHINTKEGNAVSINKGSEALSPVNETLVYSYDKIQTKKSFFSGATTTLKKGYCGSLTILTPDADTTAFFNNTVAETSSRLFNTADYEDDAAILATEKLTAYIEKTIMPAARVIAEKLSADSNALNNMQNGGGQSAQSTYERLQRGADKAASGLVGELNAIIGNYDRRMHSILQESIIAINKHNTSSGTGGNTTNQNAAGEAPWVKQIKDTGWPALGTVFWQISKNQESLNYLAKRLKATYTNPQIDQEYQDDERYATLYARLDDLIKGARAETAESGSHVFDMTAVNMAGADGSAGYFKSMFTGWFQNLMAALFIPDDEGDIITKLQYSGSVLASTTDTLIHASIIAKAGAKTAAIVVNRTHEDAVSVARQVPLIGALTGAAAAVGAGLVSTPLTLVAYIAQGYAEFLSTLIVPLLIAGFALAVVLPAIPLFYWLMGVISWMLFFVECLLISPMWLAAHGTADKDGWGSEHTRQGYMLMIGLYLNPILRVAGFFAIFLVLIPIGKLVGWLSQYLTGVLASGWLSPAMIVGGMVILAVFAYSASVRVFSLPNELFERGLRWVNGGQEVTGDSGAEQQNRMIIAQVGGKADGAASAARHLGASRPLPKADAPPPPKT